MTSTGSCTGRYLATAQWLLPALDIESSAGLSSFATSIVYLREIPSQERINKVWRAITVIARKHIDCIQSMQGVSLPKILFLAGAPVPWCPYTARQAGRFIPDC